VSKANKRERQRENRDRAREERARIAKREKQWRTTRGLLYFLVPLALVFVAIALFRGGDDSGSSGSKPLRHFDAPPKMSIDPAATYTAKIETSEGTMTAALDAKSAPVATNNFVFLARKGFYDGLKFHRIVKDFVIQGGDPKGDGSGGPGYTVTGEVPTDGYPIGALAAAKTDAEKAGTFGSQFFIVTGQNGTTLPNEYARFGRVDQGLDVAKKIESYAPDADGQPPKKDVTIEKITITES